MAGRLVAGMDLGSTGMKLLVLDDDGAELVVEEVPTPWRAGPGGTADLPAERLVAAVEQLLDDHGAAARDGHRRSRSPPLPSPGWARPAWSSTPGGSPVAPAFAWFDPRGAEQVAALPGRGPRRVRRTHRPSARAAGLRGQARLPARTGPGAGRPALAEPARVRRDDPRRASRPLSSPSPPAPGCSTRTPARRGPRCSPLSASTAAFLPPLVDAGTDLGADRGRASLRGRPPHRRRPRPPRRGRGRRPDPAPSATTSRWARPRCCSG